MGLRPAIMSALGFIGLGVAIARWDPFQKKPDDETNDPETGKKAYENRHVHNPFLPLHARLNDSVRRQDDDAMSCSNQPKDRGAHKQHERTGFGNGRIIRWRPFYGPREHHERDSQNQQ